VSCTLANDTPGIVGSGNTAGGHLTSTPGHQNTCNTTA
jgi:hypothetical protein